MTQNQLTSRKYYIDNLRAFAILLSFPFHIFMVYNNWGESWYIHGQGLWFPSMFNHFSRIWRMPLLFTIAGISSHYALRRRSAGEYAKERVSKLLLPLIFGLLLIIPIQSYIAGIYFTGHANYLDYFTKITDLSGYDGAFTPGQLWFLLFLFIIAMVCLPFMVWYKNKGQGKLGEKTPLLLLAAMGILPCIGSMVKIGGKSPTEYLAYFLLGYFFLTNDDLLKKLDKYRFLLLGLAFLSAAISFGLLDFNYYEWVSWLCVLTILGMAHRYLNFSGKITAYLANSSYGAYLFHQSWIVITAFFILKITAQPLVQIPLIFLAAISFTYLSYEICRRTPVLSLMFGQKKYIRR